MSHIFVRRSALASSLAMALLAPHAFAQAAAAASNDAPQLAQQTAPAPANPPPPGNASPQKAVDLDKVVVTGSRIPRSEIEGPAPVLIVTDQKIKAQGYQTFNEFAQSIPQAGTAETAPSWGASSVNARQLNLRNLGSDHSLLLVNGHRVADYPQPADGKSTFQNYNNIPSGMIDRVEILASGASSIYGSDAIAGVVNIILKKNYQGDDLTVTGGGATRGGRKFGDINLVGGRSGDDWHVVYNLQHTNRSPLWGRDRTYTDSEDDAGYGSWDENKRLFGFQQYPGLMLGNSDGMFITPPAGACGQFGSNFSLYNKRTVATDGHTVLPGQVTDGGSFCQQNALFRNWVLTPGLQSNDGYIYGEKDFSNGLQTYASLGIWQTIGTSNTELPFLYPMGGVPNNFYDRTTGQVISNYLRQLTPNEMGTYGNTHDHELNWDFHTGVRGTIFDGKFNWDLDLGSSRYIVHEDYTGLNEQGMFDFFFGPNLGTTTVGGTAYDTYALNSQRFYSPITPSQYSTFGVNGENSSATWMDQATFNINGDIFNTWAGPVGWAAVLEENYQGYKLSPDPRGSTTTFGDPFQDYNTGGGTRTRHSVGSEFRVPLSSMVTWTISGRFDQYRDASIANIARTWGSGIEFRPYEGLLLRGSYGTNFHAPDMQAIYQTDSEVPVGIYADPYLCITQTHDASCQPSQHSTYLTQHSGGSRNLLPETGHSWTYGFVWDIPGVQGLSVASDYWHMGIKNAINYIDQPTLLTDEAGCRTGLKITGAAYTDHGLGSEYCNLAIANVHRDSAGNITDIFVGPINERSLYVSGIDASVRYNFETHDYGNFSLDLEYTNNLSYKERILPTDPLLNTRYKHVASRVTGTLTWNDGPWDASLYGQRNGSIRAPGWNSCRRLANGIQPSFGDADCSVYLNDLKPWIVWNGSVGYRFSPKVRVGLQVNDIFNKVGEVPYDAGGFEYISNLQGATYNGREVFLNLNYKLD
ncbi:TonB-dependent receptor domain-containing protein [Pinirhizobacter soli]|uniref:TonB-dependent receptor domain-containing protein n=1 Tax=Pinirhizobacter soli TaxID=2786953 RepID=UPI00202A2C65|nr:TonB-dependent receptor [Pinirhizobacter soli]